jgi:uncharacterized protein YggU (UPF0235/DUF167 family)
LDIITVRVQPRSSRPGLEKVGEGEYKARLNSAPEAGRANAELIDLLAEHFGVPRRRIRIIRGAGARLKRVSIERGGP